MKRIIVLFTAIALILGLSACSSKVTGTTWQEQYDLGMRYLSEGNYEDAIIAFTVAIEIDPKQAPAYVGRGDAYTEMARLTPVEASELPEEVAASYENAVADYLVAISLDAQTVETYLKAADVYIALGDFVRAQEILEQGYEITEDVSLKEQLEKILLDQPNEVEGEGLIDRLLRTGATGNLLKYEEIAFFGRNVEEVDRATAKEILSQNGFPSFDEIEDHLWAWQSEPWVGTTVGVFFDDDDSMSYWRIQPGSRLGVSNLSAVATGFRDINMLDSPEDVLAKLGFSNATEILSEIYKTFDDYEYGTSKQTHLSSCSIELKKGGRFWIQLSLYDETISENYVTSRVDGNRKEPGQYLYLSYSIRIYDNQDNYRSLQFGFDENNCLKNLYSP